MTEGLCARHAIFRANVVLDVVQLAEHSDAPDFTPTGALWANVAPSVVGTKRTLGGARCHRDLLFESNSIDSGPHPTMKLYDVDGAHLRNNRITRCGSAAVSQPAAYGGGFDTVVVGSSEDVCVAGNTVVNSTAARHCTKRPRLVKTATAPAVYWLDFEFHDHVDIASNVLRKLGSCDRCGVNLCSQMGVAVVDDAFIASRVVAAEEFSCAVHFPGGRMLRAAIDDEDKEAEVFFQRSTAELSVHRVDMSPSGDCAACPGAVCLNVMNVTSASYAATLTVSRAPFQCAMAREPFEL